MARYYFHIRDSLGIIPDEEGMELLTIGAAQTEALRSAEDIARAAVDAGLERRACTIDIADEAGHIVGGVNVPELRKLA
ncbi:MAG TPA: hypothetical protein VGM68_11080 [Rhizomicrobium sp.]|jgi:hypothetical protein